MKTEGCQRNDEGEMIVVAVEGGCALATTGLCQLQSKSPAFSSSAETSAYRVQLTIQPLYGGQIANSNLGKYDLRLYIKYKHSTTD